MSEMQLYRQGLHKQVDEAVLQLNANLKHFLEAATIQEPHELSLLNEHAPTNNALKVILSTDKLVLSLSFFAHFFID